MGVFHHRLLLLQERCGEANSESPCGDHNLERAEPQQVSEWNTPNPMQWCNSTASPATRPLHPHHCISILNVMPLTSSLRVN